jgi:hypothetical protein
MCDVYRLRLLNRSMLTAELLNAPDDRFDLSLNRYRLTG